MRNCLRCLAGKQHVLGRKLTTPERQGDRMFADARGVEGLPLAAAPQDKKYCGGDLAEGIRRRWTSHGGAGGSREVLTPALQALSNELWEPFGATEASAAQVDQLQPPVLLLGVAREGSMVRVPSPKRWESRAHSRWRIAARKRVAPAQASRNTATAGAAAGIGTGGATVMKTVAEMTGSSELPRSVTALSADGPVA